MRDREDMISNKVALSLNSLLPKTLQIIIYKNDLRLLSAHRLCDHAWQYVRPSAYVHRYGGLSSTHIERSWRLRLLAPSSRRDGMAGGQCQFLDCIRDMDPFNPCHPSFSFLHADTAQIRHIQAHRSNPWSPSTGLQFHSCWLPLCWCTSVRASVNATEGLHRMD